MCIRDSITAIYYELLTQAGCQVDVIPALGSHLAMQPEEIRQMFGPDIPLERFIAVSYTHLPSSTASSCPSTGASRPTPSDPVGEGPAGAFFARLSRPRADAPTCKEGT